MSQISVNIMGNPLILCCDKDPPPETHRIGTVSLHFDHGAPVYVKVFGSLKIYKEGKKREDFEKELRRTCENPAIIEQIFEEYAGSYARSRRFNPSVAQIKRGWYSGSKATVH